MTKEPADYRVSLRDHLEKIIDLKFDKIGDRLDRDQQYVKDAFEIFNKTNDIHLDRLNHSHENIKDIASKNISQERFEGLHKELTMKLESYAIDFERRIKAIEIFTSERLGQKKISTTVWLWVAGIGGAVLTMIINYLIFGRP